MRNHQIVDNQIIDVKRIKTESGVEPSSGFNLGINWVLIQHRKYLALLLFHSNFRDLWGELNQTKFSKLNGHCKNSQTFTHHCFCRAP